MLIVKGYTVEIAKILELQHHCNPTLCGERCCCGVFDGWIRPHEIDRMQQYLSEAVKYLPSTNNNVFDYLRWVGAGYVLRKDSSGMCRLAYQNDAGHFLCALHSAAFDLGISPKDTKPDGCLLWPFCLIGRDHKTLSVQNGIYEFPCNHRRSIRLANNELDAGTSGLIEENFGEEFLEAVNRHISERSL